MTSHTHALPSSRHDDIPDPQPNTEALSFRQVMAATPMGRERYAQLFGNPRWPTAQDVADGHAEQQRGKPQRPGALAEGGIRAVTDLIGAESSVS